jgi:hypothetical protein
MTDFWGDRQGAKPVSPEEAPAFFTPPTPEPDAPSEPSEPSDTSDAVPTDDGTASGPGNRFIGQLPPPPARATATIDDAPDPSDHSRWLKPGSYRPEHSVMEDLPKMSRWAIAAVLLAAAAPALFSLLDSDIINHFWTHTVQTYGIVMAVISVIALIDSARSRGVRTGALAAIVCIFISIYFIKFGADLASALNERNGLENGILPNIPPITTTTT